MQLTEAEERFLKKREGLPSSFLLAPPGSSVHAGNVSSSGDVPYEGTHGESHLGRGLEPAAERVPVSGHPRSVGLVGRERDPVEGGPLFQSLEALELRAYDMVAT